MTGNTKYNDNSYNFDLVCTIDERRKPSDVYANFYSAQTNYSTYMPQIQV